jgi:hypothetical protein
MPPLTPAFGFRGCPFIIGAPLKGRFLPDGRLAVVVSHTPRAGRSGLQGSLSALQTNYEVPTIRLPSTTGDDDALDYSSCHLHREVLIDVSLCSDAVVRKLDLSPNTDATGEGVGLGGAR